MLTKPILVVMVWRGGARFSRCLESIEGSSQYFSKIVLSVTSTPESADMAAALKFQARHDACEVICTGKELPTMQHQDFWITYLQEQGVGPEQWIYWLAYDDQVWSPGLNAITNQSNELDLSPNTAYIGPWAMRHEQPDSLWDGDGNAPMEVWTSFPKQGPTTLPLMQWIADQLKQPTYMQMSGSVIPFANYLELKNSQPKKTGPMRIEMATAAGSQTTHVSEFSAPISVIYGRSNSDRASYGSAARKEDVHLIRYLMRHAAKHPKEYGPLIAMFGQQGLHLGANRILKKPMPKEEWRVRGIIEQQ